MRSVHFPFIKLAEYVNIYFPVKQLLLSQITLPVNIVFAKDLHSCSVYCVKCNRVKCIDDQKRIIKSIIFVKAFTPGYLPQTQYKKRIATKISLPDRSNFYSKAHFSISTSHLNSSRQPLPAYVTCISNTLWIKCRHRCGKQIYP